MLLYHHYYLERKAYFNCTTMELFIRRKWKLYRPKWWTVYDRPPKLYSTCMATFWQLGRSDCSSPSLHIILLKFSQWNSLKKPILKAQNFLRSGLRKRDRSCRVGIGLRPRVDHATSRNVGQARRWCRAALQSKRKINVWAFLFIYYFHFLSNSMTNEIHFR